ncbi:hypothetical protein [Curtobacterium sp. ME12]|uniref:hypothetical protein n=1 Tax=Curtobacterium sp. ME12 TaxID=2744253 RepID=UPI0015F59193|nr:hypothetical protein [Curtobacterium sp. ME12]
MKNLVYGSSPILVADDVAEAVVQYASALVNALVSDVVPIPTVDTAGVPTETRVLLAPGIPLLAEDAPDDVLERPYPAFVEDLQLRTLEVVASAQRNGTRD